MFGQRITQVVLALFIVLVAVASNWTYRYTQLSSEGNDTFFIDRQDSGVTQAEHFVGGWPLKFYVRIRYFEDVQFSAFSFLRLLGNVTLWIGVLIVAASYFALSRKKRVKKRLGIVVLGDLFVATFLVALVLSYLQSLRDRTDAHRSLAKQIEDAGGYAGLVLEAPSPLAGLTNRFFNDCFYRVNDVRLESPSGELLQKVIELPTLSQLRIGGGSYDLRQLDELGRNPFLQAVRVSGRTVDAQLIAALGSAKQLQSINLMRTNVTARALDGLGRMPALRYVNLTHTDVELGGTEIPEWAVNLRSIVLPHPNPGTSFNHKIHGWPNLVEFSCMEWDKWMNEEVVHLELHDLPELKLLTLDTLQLFDLDLHQLPKLSEVKSIRPHASVRIAPGEQVPEFPWVRNLSVANVPVLAELVVQGTRTNQLSFQQASNLKFGVCIQPSFARGISRWHDFGSDVPRPVRQSWIDGLADSQGPRELDYSYIPLKGLSLEPLLRNKAIRMLDVSHSGVTAGQLAVLLSMDQLEELSLLEFPFRSAKVKQIVDSLPNLQALRFDSKSLHQIKLTDHENIRSVFGEIDWQQHPGISEVHLENVPRFSDTIQISTHAMMVHLNGVPSLKRLVFKAPIPAKCTIGGLRELTVFSGGGGRLNDQIADAVLQCAGLTKLTMAFPAVSEDVFRSIGRLRHLQYLCLTGAAINDDVVRNWEPLLSLQTLRLDQTEVGSGALTYVTRLQDLQRLWIDGLDEGDFGRLLKLPKLRELHVGGATVSPSSMADIVQIPELRELGLTKCTLDRETMSILLREFPQELLVLDVSESTVDGSALRKLAEIYPHLRFGISNTVTDPSALDYMVANNRVATDDPNPFPRSAVPRNAPSQANDNAATETDDFGEIDPQFFSWGDQELGLESDRITLPNEMPSSPVDRAEPRRPPTNPFERFGNWLGGVIAPPPPQPEKD